jgi:ribosomal-protein-alanine N-acetyltransferase
MAQWAVILKEAGQFIGECGISVQHIDNVEEFEIGYRFAKKYWGEGYATEAAIACQKYGTEQFSVKRYISIIEKENIRSIRVAEKGGMTLEKESVFHGIPVLIYSLEV